MSDSGIATLLERSVVFTISIGKFGNSKSLDKSAITVDSDDDMISANKTLLKSQTYKDIVNLDAGIRRYKDEQSIPGLLRQGLAMVPVLMVEAIEKRMLEFQVQRDALVNRFVSEYDFERRKAELALKSNFSESDYPPSDELRRRFFFYWQYLSLSTAGNLPASMIEAEREKIHTQMQETFLEARLGLRAGLKALLDNATEKLSNDGDGKRKTFAPAIRHLTEFVELFTARDVTGDTELESLAEMARTLTTGVDLSDLRESTSIRQYVISEMKNVSVAVESLIQDMPVRTFNFNE